MNKDNLPYLYYLIILLGEMLMNYVYVLLGEFYRSRLSRKHLVLISYSKMSVKLAAQTLSEKVVQGMENYPDLQKRNEMSETAKFIKMMDR